MTDSEPKSTKRPEEVLVDAIYAEADRIQSEPAQPAPPTILKGAYRNFHEKWYGRESLGQHLEDRHRKESVSNMETEKHRYPAKRFIEHVQEYKECFTKINLDATYKSKSVPSNDSNDSNYTYFLADTKARVMQALVFLGKLKEATTVKQTISPDGDNHSSYERNAPTLVFENKTITEDWGWANVYKYDASVDNCSDALTLTTATPGGKRRTRRNKKKNKKTKKGKTTKKSKRKPRGSRRKR
jgi:hypothetical protein